MLVLGPWAGLVADRSDKRRLLLIVQTLAMVQSFVLAALAFSGDPPVGAIYVVALVGGVTMAFDNPARRAFVVEMVPPDDIHNAVSLNSALMTVVPGGRPGPGRPARHHRRASAGPSSPTACPTWPCWPGCGCMRTAELRPAPVAPRAKGQVREGLRYVRSVARAVRARW